MKLQISPGQVSSTHRVSFATTSQAYTLVLKITKPFELKKISETYVLIIFTGSILSKSLISWLLIYSNKKKKLWISSAMKYHNWSEYFHLIFFLFAYILTDDSYGCDLLFIWVRCMINFSANNRLWKRLWFTVSFRGNLRNYEKKFENNLMISQPILRFKLLWIKSESCEFNGFKWFVNIRIVNLLI